MQIHARKVLSFPTNQLWSMITGEFEIVFDNGEVVKTHERDLIYSSYFWDFHRRLYATPLLPEHLVRISTEIVAIDKPIIFFIFYFPYF